ncbi:GNAT family N-acetyltransferase [bacterium]|nr:GNAT family N-acetyltransferase [bacterium]
MRPAAGLLRPALPGDLELARRWNDQFFQDVGTTERAPGLVERLISGNHLFIWEDGEPKSLVAGVGRTPHGIRISFVFTPPELRRQGYATTCVAELSRRYLAEGLQFCFLYTDMANPTSNSIYQNIGYRQVCDVVDWQVI